LLIEVEGLRETVEEQAEAIHRVCRKQNAREVRRARNEHERKLLWAGRKNAAGAVGPRLPRSRGFTGAYGKDCWP
jgi:FAD/FMN-containing dehydrogenase